MRFRPEFARTTLRFAWVFCAAFTSLFAAPPPVAPRAEAPSILDSSHVAGQSRGASTVSFKTSMEVLNDSTKLGIGDHVSFRIVEDRHDPIRLFVTDSGEIHRPRDGARQEVQAARL